MQAVNSMDQLKMFLRCACFLATLFILNTVAHAQSCDCSTRTGSCSSTARLEGQRLYFSATTQQCAQVIYSLDGEPSSITITGGAGDLEYLRTRTGDPRVSVQSCSICTTTGTSDAPSPTKRNPSSATRDGFRSGTNGRFKTCIKECDSTAELTRCMQRPTREVRTACSEAVLSKQRQCVDTCTDAPD